MDTEPIVTSLSGVAAGGVLTYLGQWLTDRRTQHREALRIRAEMISKRDFAFLELQQSTIVELQDAMRQMWSTARAIDRVDGADEQREIYATAGVGNGHIVALLSRLNNRELAENVRQWLTKVQQRLPEVFIEGRAITIDEVEEWRTQLSKLLEELGDELRSSLAALLTRNYVTGLEIALRCDV